MDEHVIDFKALEENMREIENIFKDKGLNGIEQSLILSQLQVRINKKVEEQKAKDMLGNMPMMDIINNMLKKREKE